MRILLAESETMLAKSLVNLLKKNNYAAENVWNGRDALHYLESGGYDAAILDPATPELDGPAVLKRLRAAGNNIPVLLLSDQSGIEEKVLALDSGANDYLTKPFDERELLARLRVMIRTAGAPAPVLSLGSVTLDPASFTLSTPFGGVRLPNKEYQMMETLMAQRGRLISTERLMEKIWGLDAETEIGVVWVNLSYLRKKLAALNADIRIVSFRNAGYRLEKIP